MNAAQTAMPPASGAWVADFTLRRLERALRQRARYRYVHPRVLREGGGFRIECACCSRNVDPTGGVIDIALLLPCALPSTLDAPAPRRWSLHARDHAISAWVPRQEDAPLNELLDLLCTDADRVFWP